MTWRGYHLPVFEWDTWKADENRAKHGVAFGEAATVFFDGIARSQPDGEHSSALERRYRIVGMSESGRLLVVAYTERGEKLRIISARRATRSEREDYEESE